MLAIHPVHRRMTEIFLIMKQRRLTIDETIEMNRCIQVNANLVQKLDGLKELAFQAHIVRDMQWVQEISGKIEELEAKCL